LHETKNHHHRAVLLCGAFRGPFGELVVAYDRATTPAKNRYDACATIAHYTGERQ
jgi:hypothetical protein